MSTCAVAPSLGMQPVLNAIRNAPVRTHADVLALLSATVGVVQECESHLGMDFSLVLDHLSDAEGALEDCYVEDQS